MSKNSINTALVQWYGTPLSRQDAQTLAHTAGQRLDRWSSRGKVSFAAIMMQTIADWWLNNANTLCLTRGIHYATSKRKLACYHLIVGQLLMSCKMQMAFDYLDMGLRHADGLINATDYFTLYNRHEELRFLPLFTTRQRPHDLAELLNESRVIRKLAPRSGYSIPKSRHD